jgi:hypothetical protein
LIGGLIAEFRNAERFFGGIFREQLFAIGGVEVSLFWPVSPSIYRGQNCRGERITTIERIRHAA